MDFTEIAGVSIQGLVQAVERASEKVLEVYSQDFEVDYKGDSSPLTEADRISHQTLCEHLLEHHPEIPILSEEGKAAPYEERKGWKKLWILDPLDGTKEFVKKNGEFTINLALVENGIPILGIVQQPVTQKIHLGIVGHGAWQREKNNAWSELKGGPSYKGMEHVRLVASRSHMTPEVEDFAQALKDSGKTVDFCPSGSSLKICLVAEGAADVYPRFGPTMEWDTAAAHAVATSSGRQILSIPDGTPLQYNKANLLNPYFIVE